MIIDLIHNKIVAGTISTGFEKSVEEDLVPKLLAKYGDTEIVGIQMYEDYISDSFMKNGYWYYPLTVVTAENCFTEWVKWAVNGDSFEGGVPYAYVGEGNIEFKLTENVPSEFEDKLVGRARFCEEGLVKLQVEISAGDITMLSGKYSQTFIDEMARQLTAAIGRAMSVEGLAESSLEFSLVFAPGTYMEHISENVTYRRLILSDKASAPRDFWIKWTRLDGAVAYSCAANVDRENILFELGEDVSQKIREKEYRYLVHAGKDKYHNAMGRKNVTEWREVVKRAIRRGELVKVEKPVELAPETRALEEKLADVLGRAGVAVPDRNDAAENITSPQDNAEFERAMQKMREVAFAESSDEEIEAEESAPTVELAAEETEETDTVSEETESVAQVEEPAEELATTAADSSEDGEIVFDEEDTDEAEDAGDVTEVEFFDEEEDEEEELDELETLYAEDDSALEISEGAIAANDEEAAELEEITRLAMEALREAKERAEAEAAEANAEDAEEPAVTEALEEAEEADESEEFVLEGTTDAEEDEDSDGEFEEFADEEMLEDDAIALEELAMLEPDAEESCADGAADSMCADECAAETAEDNTSENTAENTAENTDECVVAPEAAMEESALELAVPAPEATVPVADDEPIVSAQREMDIRAELEAKIRLEYESRARRLAEEETARLRREQEAQRIENERQLAAAKREQERMRAEYEKLLEDTKRQNEEREAKEAARRAEEEKLRAQIEAQLRREARERERLAEAARMAIEEQRRLEEENAKRAREREEEEKRVAEERLRREAEAKAVAARAAEAERIRREEEAAKAAAAAAMPTVGDGKYSYTSKTVKLVFRRSVDPNITSRIHEIIKATMEYYGKDKVFMKIRASVPDSQNVNLEFLQIPIEEMELLSNIIKILGNSGLGIAKAIVE